LLPVPVTFGVGYETGANLSLDQVVVYAEIDTNVDGNNYFIKIYDQTF
jgi:hypothetical protein